MAVKLIMRKSRTAFIRFIQTANEHDADQALWDAWMAKTNVRMPKHKRAEITETLNQAEREFEKRFGTWLPF